MVWEARLIALAAVLIDRGKLTPEGTFLGTMEDMQEAYIDLAEKNVFCDRHIWN